MYNHVPDHLDSATSPSDGVLSGYKKGRIRQIRSRGVESESAVDIISRVTGLSWRNNHHYFSYLE